MEEILGGQVEVQPREGSRPLALSSACSWQSAQLSQQKWTQQSQQGSAVFGPGFLLGALWVPFEGSLGALWALFGRIFGRIFGGRED